jgi:hypothetical protein
MDGKQGQINVIRSNRFLTDLFEIIIFPKKTSNSIFHIFKWPREVQGESQKLKHIQVI